MNINSTYSSAAFGLLIFFSVPSAAAFDLKPHLFASEPEETFLQTPYQQLQGQQGIKLNFQYDHWREKLGESHQYWVESAQFASIRKRTGISGIRLGFYGQQQWLKDDIRHKDKDWQVALPQATQQSHNYAVSVGMGPFLIASSQYKNQETLSIGVDSREGLQLSFAMGEREFNTDVSGNLKGRDFILRDHSRYAVRGIEFNLQREVFDIYFLSLNDKNDLYRSRSLKVSSGDYFAEYSYQKAHSPAPSPSMPCSTKLKAYQPTLRTLTNEFWVGFSDIQSKQKQLILGGQLAPETQLTLVQSSSELVTDISACGIQKTAYGNTFVTLDTTVLRIKQSYSLASLNLTPELGLGRATLTGASEGLLNSVFLVPLKEFSRLPYKHMDYLSLDLPVRWQSGALAIEYRMQQLIPLSIKYREGYGDNSELGSGSGSANFSRLPDMNMQTLSIHYNF